MPVFITTRNRDAWATIRGYVYQVELTIERWLQLQPGQVLELERGEDIDIVQNALFVDEEEQSRLLEQIKHREVNLTMRVPQALEALASYYEHLSANPESDLSFRYVTNAGIGTERLSPLPGRIPAIKAWNQVRLGKLGSDNQAGVLAGIRRLLGTAEKPDGLREQTWAAFAGFISRATDEDLLQFIRRFEWQTQKIVSGSLKLAILQVLIAKYDASPEIAQAIYERLFFYIFKLLSRRERKQLTADDLQTQLKMPALNAADQRLSDNLRILLSEIETRVVALEEGYKQQQQSIKQIESELQSLSQQVGVNVAVEYAFNFPQLDMPTLADPIIKRQTIVAQYVEQQRVKTWCALYGEVGRGKTYLLRMIAEVSPPAVWIRLEGLEGNRACLQTDSVFSALSGTRPTPYRQRWYDNICSELDPGTLIVLDDLPRMTGNDLLSERCMMIAQACASHNIKLLSSSPYNLPMQIRQSLGDVILLSEQAPSFTDQEIQELFAACGAPEEFIVGRGVEWLAVLTERNPTLLVAAARYLAQHNWDLATEAFDGIARGIYAQEVNEQTQLLLRETVPDTNDRELLYRLNLVQGAFDEANVRCVSEVAPVITLPEERLVGALGLWVQRDSERTYRISPLLNQLGGGNLESGVKRNIHLALGESILEKHILGPFDVFDAVNHFHSGETFNKAGVILLRALWTIQHDEKIIDDWGISSLWYNVPLPAAMDLNIRLILRASQIAVCHRFGKDVSYLVADLDNLLEQAGDENAAWVVGAAIMVGSDWVKENPIRANRYLLMALHALPNARLAGGDRLTFSDMARPESLIWLNGYGIKSREELQNWLSTLEQFTLDQRRAALEGGIAEHGSFIVATSLWLVEYEKPEAERNWDDVIGALVELSERARNLSFDLLWARSINSRILTMGQNMDNLGAAEALARDALASASKDSTVRFVIQEAIGRQFAQNNHLEEALPWLTAALAEQTNAYAFERLTILLHASRAVGETDGALALRYTEQAVQLGEEALGVSEKDLVVMKK